MPEKKKTAREKLLACAKEQLLAGSYETLGVRDIVKACGFSIGAFYREFRSKEELIITVLNEDWADMLRHTDEHFSPEAPARENLRLLFDGMGSFEQQYGMSLLGSLVGKKQFAEAERENRGKICAQAERMLRAASERGEFGPGLDFKKAACLTVWLGIAAGREPEVSFDEAWDILTLLAQAERADGAGGNAR